MESKNGKTQVNKKRVFVVTTKRMMANYIFYSQKNGYNTVSEALRTGIKMWAASAIELKSKIDEETLPKVSMIEELNGGKIVEWKYDTNDFEIHLEENLLQRFDKFRIQKGFKSRTKAVRAIMFCQILEWKKVYEITKNKEKIIINISIKEGERKLNQKLEGLKQAFEQGKELDVIWLPKTDSPLDGEIIGKKVYIYSLNYQEAEKTLSHEYIEYALKENFSKPYINLVNKLIKSFSMENYEKQEKIIEKLVENLK
jgi:hypothetical protein